MTPRVPWFDLNGPFLRPDHPAPPARAAAVKEGRRPPATPAHRVLDRREHDGIVNHEGVKPKPPKLS